MERRSISNCEYVCIGGGGAGGDYAGPYPGYNSGAVGGGAGGMKWNFPSSGSGSNIPITVGSGGASNVSSSGSYAPQPSETKHKVVVHRSSHLIWSPVQ